MIQAIIITALIAVVAISAFGQAGSGVGGQKDKSEVIALAKQYANALVARDAAILDGILAPDYGDVSAEGWLNTRFLLLRMVKETPTDYPRLNAIKLDDELAVVHIHGDSAVLVTRIELDWPTMSEEVAKKWKSSLPEHNQYMVTLVAVRDGGKWQIVSTQESPILWKVAESKKPQ